MTTRVRCTIWQGSDQLVGLRCGDRRGARSEGEGELLAFSQSSSGGLKRFAALAASVAWRQSAPPSERTVEMEGRECQLGNLTSRIGCERTMPLWEQTASVAAREYSGVPI